MLPSRCPVSIAAVMGRRRPIVFPKCLQSAEVASFCCAGQRRPIFLAIPEIGGIAAGLPGASVLWEATCLSVAALVYHGARALWRSGGSKVERGRQWLRISAVTCACGRRCSAARHAPELKGDGREGRSGLASQSGRGQACLQTTSLQKSPDAADPCATWTPLTPAAIGVPLTVRMLHRRGGQHEAPLRAREEAVRRGGGGMLHRLPAYGAPAPPRAGPTESMGAASAPCAGGWLEASLLQSPPAGQRLLPRCGR